MNHLLRLSLRQLSYNHQKWNHLSHQVFSKFQKERLIKMNQHLHYWKMSKNSILLQYQQRHTLLLLTRRDARISLTAHTRQLRKTANLIWTMTPEKHQDWVRDLQRDRIQRNYPVSWVKKAIFSKQKIKIKFITHNKIKVKRDNWEEYIWEVLTYMGITEL